jgi:hypothetical protein
MEVEGQSSPSPPSKKQRRTESKAGDGVAGAPKISERIAAHLAAFESQDLDCICQSYDEESVIVRWDWSEKTVRLFGGGSEHGDTPP